GVFGKSAAKGHILYCVFSKSAAKSNVLWQRLWENTFRGVCGESAAKGELDLSLNNLISEIAKELKALKMITRLLLSDNQFSGKVPSKIGHLSNLEELNLASNNLSGNIPDDLTNYSKLFEFEQEQS
ncbi:hypothetical protein Gogos_003693, partial [Gossypium gossypioides]|nr:hypothetical protein [Gossypium gossypioides]